jgi:Zn-dependent protease
MTTARQSVRPLASLFWLFFAPVVWFAHLAVVYGAEALICTLAVTRPSVMIWFGAAATAAALTALIAFAFLMSRPAHRTEHTDAAFLHSAALLLALLAGLGVVWTAFPLAVLPVCALPTV